MGTSDFAVTILEALWQTDHELSCIITQPDRPQGRGMHQQASPVKLAAINKGYKNLLFQPENLRATDSLEFLRTKSCDIIVTAAYGQILPQSLLDYPHIASINVHGSLLPAYRGAAPIQRAIMAGERETGITIMHMARRLDSGDIIAQSTLPILPNQDQMSLSQQLAELGASLLLQVLSQLEQGIVLRRKQDEAFASYASMITKVDCFLDWMSSAQEWHDIVRGLHPNPGAILEIRGKRLKIRKTELRPLPLQDFGVTPGTIIALENGFPIIAVGSTESRNDDSKALLLLEVQPEGKKTLPAASWLIGSKYKLGMCLR